ncbi:MAG: hypothetical protein V2A56_08900 [bacterium]
MIVEQNLESHMADELAELLKDHGIPYRHIGQAGSVRVVVPVNAVKANQLRSIGFRLGHGQGAIRYLLYYQGRFCGVVM